MLGKEWAGKNNAKKTTKKIQHLCLNLFFTLNFNDTYPDGCFFYVCV